VGREPRTKEIYDWCVLGAGCGISLARRLCGKRTTDEGNIRLVRAWGGMWYFSRSKAVREENHGRKKYPTWARFAGFVGGKLRDAPSAHKPRQPARLPVHGFDGTRSIRYNIVELGMQ